MNILSLNSVSWFLDTLHDECHRNTWDENRKIFVSNVGGWNTSEYPVNRIEIQEIEVKRTIIGNPYYKDDKRKIKVVALIKTDKEDYAKKKCITMGELLNFIQKQMEVNDKFQNYMMGCISESELKDGGWFCQIIGMRDASKHIKHDCDNKKARKVYGKNVFRLWY